MIKRVRTSWSGLTVSDSASDYIWHHIAHDFNNCLDFILYLAPKLSEHRADHVVEGAGHVYRIEYFTLDFIKC